jgi:hypothetical protein
MIKCSDCKQEKDKNNFLKKNNIDLYKLCDECRKFYKERYYNKPNKNNKEHFSNEYILPNNLTNIQHEVLTGGLLGDLYMSLDGKYPRIGIKRQYLDYNYLNWEYEIFKDLCKSQIKSFDVYDKRYDTIKKYCSFRTRAVPAFLDYYNKWYPNGKKIVPNNLEFTPMILAIWFADDGSVRNRGKRELEINFATNSFGENYTQFLAEKLEKRYNLKFPIYKKKDKDQFLIRAGSESSQRFLKEITPYIIQINMIRKYNVWKDLSLDIKPSLSGHYKNYKMLYDAILELNDFSINEISKIVKIYDPCYLRLIINNFCKKQYIYKYKSTDFNKPHRYVVNELGKDFFSIPPIDNKNIEE